MNGDNRYHHQNHHQKHYHDGNNTNNHCKSSTTTGISRTMSYISWDSKQGRQRIGVTTKIVVFLCVLGNIFSSMNSARHNSFSLSQTNRNIAIVANQPNNITPSWIKNITTTQIDRDFPMFNASMAREDLRLVYLHVGKTGGTSLDKILKSNCQWYHEKKHACLEQLLWKSKNDTISRELVLSERTAKTLHVRAARVNAKPQFIPPLTQSRRQVSAACLALSTD